MEVVPLVDTEAGIAIGQAGQTGIDYALKMRQFPQVDLLSERFARGEVTATDCEAIAILLAQLHANAQSDATISAFGDVATIKQTADDNYAYTAKYVGLAQTEQQLAATRAYSNQIFNEQAAWFRERQAQGKIKECHGDLHLGNICLFEGAIQLFDCSVNSAIAHSSKSDRLWAVAFAGAYNLTREQLSDRTYKLRCAN
ncbi:MAG: hypothetical protein HC926_04315 [Synechococcaceae cyanobacterium SM2_3_60]|nr:hypothetical protein [Synechococcaceae cyanobacterium SM2_3_60]